MSIWFDEDRADSDVIEAVLALRNRNPCSIVETTIPTGVVDTQKMSEIDEPVLLVYPNAEEPVDDPQAQRDEAGLYGSTDVTTVWMDSGHFPELEGSAPHLRSLLARWIQQRWPGRGTIAGSPLPDDACVTEVVTKT